MSRSYIFFPLSACMASSWTDLLCESYRVTDLGEPTSVLPVCWGSTTLLINFRFVIGQWKIERKKRCSNVKDGVFIT
jgi:hypothetical protein